MDKMNITKVQSEPFPFPNDYLKLSDQELRDLWHKIRESIVTERSDSHATVYMPSNFKECLRAVGAELDNRKKILRQWMREHPEAVEEVKRKYGM